MSSIISISGQELQPGDFVRLPYWHSAEDPSGFWEVSSVDPSGRYFEIYCHKTKEFGKTVLDDNGFPVSNKTIPPLRYDAGSKTIFKWVTEVPYDPTQMGDKEDDI
jgi:hypothetical protein